VVERPRACATRRDRSTWSRRRKANGINVRIEEALGLPDGRLHHAPDGIRGVEFSRSLFQHLPQHGEVVIGSQFFFQLMQAFEHRAKPPLGRGSDAAHGAAHRLSRHLRAGGSPPSPVHRLAVSCPSPSSKNSSTPFRSRRVIPCPTLAIACPSLEFAAARFSRPASAARGRAIGRACSSPSRRGP
jgi:hypothetical protein